MDNNAHFLLPLAVFEWNVSWFWHNFAQLALTYTESIEKWVLTVTVLYWPLQCSHYYWNSTKPQLIYLHPLHQALQIKTSAPAGLQCCGEPSGRCGALVVMRGHFSVFFFFFFASTSSQFDFSDPVCHSPHSLSEIRGTRCNSSFWLWLNSRQSDVDLLTCVKRFAAVGQLTDLITQQPKVGCGRGKKADYCFLDSHL